MGVFAKTHIDSKTLRPDIRQCIRTLKQLVIKTEIRSIGFIRDLAVLTLADWAFLIEQCNQTFKGLDVTIVFFRNNLPVPKVEERYRLIKEYHESAIGGHKGITKTYDRLAHEYYWRNM